MVKGGVVGPEESGHQNAWAMVLRGKGTGGKKNYGTAP